VSILLTHVARRSNSSGERSSTSYNKYVSGSAHFVRSDLHVLGRSDIVFWQVHSVSLSKDERVCCGHVGNI
jgi:hypothetical protein